MAVARAPTARFESFDYRIMFIISQKIYIINLLFSGRYLNFKSNNSLYHKRKTIIDSVDRVFIATPEFP